MSETSTVGSDECIHPQVAVGSWASCPWVWVVLVPPVEFRTERHELCASLAQGLQGWLHLQGPSQELSLTQSLVQVRAPRISIQYVIAADRGSSYTWAFLGETGGLVADASGFATDFGLDGASCCGAAPVGLCNALYTLTAAGSARIFVMRSALVAFGGRETEAFLRISLRSVTLRAFLTPRV